MSISGIMLEGYPADIYWRLKSQSAVEGRQIALM